MELVLLLGAVAAASGAIWKFWLHPFYKLLRDALRAAIEAKDLLYSLEPLAENQQRILRLLDENGGGWRDRTTKRLEKMELRIEQLHAEKR